jgi:hypothetical protein
MLDHRNKLIVEFVREHPECSSKEVFGSLSHVGSYATIKRILSQLSNEQLIETIGKGKATKYKLADFFEFIEPIDIDLYFQKEIDERIIKNSFNFELFEGVLKKFNLFYPKEIEKLDVLQSRFVLNTTSISPITYQKEMERLAIDLSWKSSQIEGNTYSLLETEKLLKDKETASGKTKDEAVMLLNHKVVIDFIIAQPDYLFPLTISKIVDIHSLLIKDLNIDKNVRKSRVGISGTNYKPLDNEFQIIDALNFTCDLINSKENAFEKALLALVLVSYIQPFQDGNKRTARIVSNAILLHDHHCPLSFRTVDSVDYKKAMLLFYEQNNISAIKKIFIDQYEFAVNTYF